MTQRESDNTFIPSLIDNNQSTTKQWKYRRNKKGLIVFKVDIS